MRWPLVIVLALAALAGARSITPPALVAPSGPEDFSHAGAWAFLERIATAPHPTGSAAHRAVRDALVAELKRLGFAPEVQAAVGINRHYTAAGRIENVLARLDPPGPRAPGTRDAVLLVAHSDSRTHSHGAGDDGSGLAGLVEAMRALKAGPPLKRPVIFLCTDGEEQGLLGAEAFLDSHPWAREVAVVVNVEARGVSGPALLFETSPEAGALVRGAAEAAPGVTGTSLAGEVYRRMPNDTDLSVFLEAGLPGLNFAINQGWPFYHTERDDPAHVDPRSVAHLGRTALALARRWGGADALPEREPDLVYFNVGPVLVRYSKRAGDALAMLVGVVLLAACSLALTRGTGRGAAAAFGAALLGLLAAAACAAAVSAGAFALHGGVLGEGDVLRSPWYFAAMLAAATAAMLAACAAGSALGAHAEAWSAAALGAWAALAFATADRMPGASYLFAWPALLAAPGLLAAARIGLVWQSILLAPVAFVLGWTGYLFHLSLGNAPAGAIAIGVLAALAVLLCAPAVGIAGAPAQRRGAALAGALALACALGGAVLERPTDERPDQCWLGYGLDADAKRAYWAGPPRAPSRWTAGKLGAAPERRTLPDILPTRPDEVLAVASAPVLDLAAPEVTVLETRPEPGGLRVRARLRSPRGATVLWMALPAARLREVRFAGRALPKPGTGQWGDTGYRRRRRRLDHPERVWALDACGVPADGVELEVAFTGTDPLPLRIADFSAGLPPALVPPGSMPRWLVAWDQGPSTVVARRAVLR